MVKLNNTFGFSKSLLDTIKLIGDSTESVPVSTPKSIISQHLVEADKTYPFKANQLAPLVVQLRSILNFLSKSGVLGKMMKENRELFDVYVDSEITDTQLDEMIKFVDTLVEGRPKGSTNKNKMSNSMSNSEKPEKSQKPEEDDNEQDDAYSPASRSGGEHVMAHLWSASDLPSGGDIQTQNGSRKVSQDLAKQFLLHFGSLKPPERASHSAIIHGSEVNPEKTPSQMKTAELMKGLSPEVSDNKKGAGRPKKIRG